jgi:hypothetical protein
MPFALLKKMQSTEEISEIKTFYLNLDNCTFKKLSPFKKLPFETMSDTDSDIEIESDQEEYLDSDLYAAALILTRIRKGCTNCGAQTSPTWRFGWYYEPLRKHVSLCNACGLKYSKKQYCAGCKFIYGNNCQHRQEMLDGKWFRCSGCNHYSHTKCLVEEKTTECPVQNVIDINHYKCPNCEQRSNITFKNSDFGEIRSKKSIFLERWFSNTLY